MSAERYLPDEIYLARQAGLADYLISLGVPLVKDGSRYRHREHDSLVITKNAFYWNSKSAKGNTVDFLTQYMDAIGLQNLKFADAVAELTGRTHFAQPELPKPAPFDFEKLNLAPDMGRIIKYLSDTRKIDRSIIEWLIANRYLFQELIPYPDKKTGETKEMSNAIFPIYDERCQIVGAETAGTSTCSRYKGIKTGSAFGYGYSLQAGESARFILFFESAIDLLSFINIEKLKNKSLLGCRLVSLAGLKGNIFERTIKAMVNPAVPVLCVDNDSAGVEFIKKIKTTFPQTKVHRPDRLYKDWNEQLCGIKPLPD